MLRFVYLLVYVKGRFCGQEKSLRPCYEQACSLREDSLTVLLAITRHGLGPSARLAMSAGKVNRRLSLGQTSAAGLWFVSQPTTLFASLACTLSARWFRFRHAHVLSNVQGWTTFACYASSIKQPQGILICVGRSFQTSD